MVINEIFGKNFDTIVAEKLILFIHIFTIFH